MRRGLLLVIVLALASAGCTREVVGRINALDLNSVLTGPRSPIPAVVARGVGVSRTLAGACIVLLGLYLWYCAQRGRPWVEMLYDLFVWGGLCTYLLLVTGTAYGPERWIYDAGTALGSRFGVEQGVLWANLWGAGSKAAERVMSIQQLAQSPNIGTATDASARWIQSAAFLLTSPTVAGLFAVNAAAMWFIDRVAHIFYVWLMGFYWMVGGLVIWTVILPQTRYVWFGWLKSYISVALWPLFFALAQNLAVAMPLSTWLGVDQATRNPFDLVGTFVQSQLMLLALNFVTLVIYLTIPIASYKIVNGATAPFRGLS